MEESADDQDILDFFEERAALIEFDGGQPRRLAEVQAAKQTMEEFEITRREVAEACARAREPKAGLANRYSTTRAGGPI